MSTYISMSKEKKKQVLIYNILRIEQGISETKGLATKQLKMFWRLGKYQGQSVEIWNKADTVP